MVVHGTSRLAGSLLLAVAAWLAAAAAPASGEVRDWLSPEDGETVLSGPPAVEDADVLPDESFLMASAESRPRWSARLGAVILQRAQPRSEPLLSELGTGRRLLDPGQLDFPFRGGVDAGLLWRGNVADVELRYFGVEGWTAAQGPVVSLAGAQLHFPDEPPFTDPIGARLSGASALQSVELNVRRNTSPNWSWLAGLRYLAFRDAMKLQIGDPSLSSYGQVVFGATNNLFGLQIGGDGILWHNGYNLRLESAIKAGVYVDGVGITLHGSGGGDEFLFRTGKDHTAFVGDLNFVGVYQWNKRWALRAGYQLLWLSGVATGSAQLGGLIPDGFLIDTSSTVFFHGVLLGVERSW